VKQLRVLQHEYTFDERLCACDACELKPSVGTFVHSQRPAQWNGLMVIGEGPGVNEVRLKTPFVGPSGQLLNAVLKQAGVDRDHVYVANATGCLPPSHAKGLSVDFPNAVPSCRGRLMREIEFYRPRVVLTLGAAALETMTGKFITRKKRQPINCAMCAGTLTLPTWTCGGCKTEFLQPGVVPAIVGCQCGWQGAPVLNKRKRKCPTCDGRKTRELEVQEWETEHTVHHVAGGVFRGPDLGLPEGVAYVIPTYHPASLIRKAESKAGKSFGGQFLVSAMITHVQKAVRLLTEEARWHVEKNEVTTAEGLDQWLLNLPYGSPDWIGVDIETDAKDPFDVATIKCVGLTAYYTDAMKRAASNTTVCNTWLPRTDDDWAHERKEAAAWCEVWEPETPVDDVVRRTIVDRQALIEDVKRLLVSDRFKFAWQNGIGYDLQVLWRCWSIEARVDHDTLVGHNSIAPDEPHKLQHIVFTYTDASPWKPPRKSGGIEVFKTREELFLYNARDVAGTAAALEPMLREIRSDQAEFVYQLDLAKSMVGLGMERFGMAVDVSLWESMRTDWAVREEVAKATLREIAGSPDFNPNSAQQLQTFLYDTQGPCKFIAPAHTATGQPSTEKTSLLKLRGATGNLGPRAAEAIETIFEWRRAKDRVANYFGRRDEEGEQTTGVVVGPDARIRARWKPLGARTGRWSSEPNLQNWTKTKPADPKRGIAEVIGMRRCIKAPPGRKFVGADMAQAELRMIAALSGDAKLIEICMRADEARKLEPEWDPHSYVASFVFPNYTTLDLKNPIEKAIRKALRDVVKRVIYGLNYGAGPDTVLEAIYDGDYDGPPITVEMIMRVIDTYFKLFPDVRTFRDSVLEQARRTGYLYESMSMRRRIFPLKDVPPTEASNLPIQAGTATLMDCALLELVHVLPQVDATAYPFAQVHDAIYVEAAEDKADIVGHLLEACMSCRVIVKPGAPPMDFLATYHVADTWDEAA